MKFHGGPWKARGKSVESPWKVRGKSVESPWKVRGKSVESPWNSINFFFFFFSMEFHGIFFLIKFDRLSIKSKNILFLC
jgi:hypothetical protein